MNEVANGLMLVVAAALCDASGRILVQQRPAGRTHAGLWEFPGGKLEAGETPERALVRELAEELGIVVDPAALTPVSFASEPAGARHIILLLYLCERWTGAPQPLEAAELRWVLPGDLAVLDMPPADRPLATALAIRAAMTARP